MYDGMLKWALLLLFHANAIHLQTLTFLNMRKLSIEHGNGNETRQPVVCMANYEITFPPIVSVSWTFQRSSKTYSNPTLYDIHI